MAVLLLTSAGTMLCASGLSLSLSLSLSASAPLPFPYCLSLPVSPAMTMALPKETAGAALQDTVTRKDNSSIGSEEGIPLTARP